MILSGHGREIGSAKILDAVEHNRAAIFFCDAQKSPAWLCSLLAEAGLGAVEAVVGERLGAKDERVSRGEARALAKESGVSARLIERHRNYIVAAALLLDGDYPVLSSYLGSIRRYLEGQNRREAAVCAQS